MQRAPFKALIRDIELSQSLLDHLQAEPWRYGFFALMRRIGANPAIDMIGTARLPQAEPFRLGQQPGLVFAPREIASIGVVHERLKVRLFGLGMLGPNGSLPIHVTEIAREREEHRGDPTAALEIRMNALQSLTDTDGLISDLREIALTRSTATRLQLRDVERAFAHPRPSDSLTPDSVTRQLEELRMQRPSVLSGFDDALESVTAIEGWCREHLSVYAPDLSALRGLLGRVAAGPRSRPAHDAPEEENNEQQRSQEPAALAELPAVLDASEASALPVPVIPRTIGQASDRHAALDLIREARLWFELHEPSSPIPVLLKRAEQFVGKRYADVVTAIPAELLAQWEREE